MHAYKIMQTSILFADPEEVEGVIHIKSRKGVSGNTGVSNMLQQIMHETNKDMNKVSMPKTVKG